MEESCELCEVLPTPVRKVSEKPPKELQEMIREDDPAKASVRRYSKELFLEHEKDSSCEEVTCTLQPRCRHKARQA